MLSVVRSSSSVMARKRRTPVLVALSGFDGLRLDHRLLASRDYFIIA